MLRDMDGWPWPAACSGGRYGTAPSPGPSTCWHVTNVAGVSRRALFRAASNAPLELAPPPPPLLAAPPPLLPPPRSCSVTGHTIDRQCNNRQAASPGASQGTTNAYSTACAVGAVSHAIPPSLLPQGAETAQWRTFSMLPAAGGGGGGGGPPLGGGGAAAAGDGCAAAALGCTSPAQQQAPVGCRTRPAAAHCSARFALS